MQIILRLVLTIFFQTILAFSIYTQVSLPLTPTLSHSLKRFIYDYESNSEIVSENLKQEYDIYCKSNICYLGVLAIVEEKTKAITTLKEKGVIISPNIADLYSLRVPVNEVKNLQAIQGVKFFDIGEPVSPFLENSAKNTRADSVYAGLGGLSKGYTGKGTIIAIIDWGFDYTHPVFRDTAMQQYRIVRAWDQNKMSGPAPMGYDFGTEYNSMEALMAAQEDTLYVFGPGSHGTHVAGIAGGAGAGTVHRGIAFESELIFISLRRDAPSLIDAFTYIEKYAKSVKKSFVVNMSFGTHLGPHDGMDLKNVGLDKLAGRGKIFVGSAGNNGEGPFHLSHKFLGTSDTLRTVVNFSGHPEYFGQTLSMWGSSESAFGARLLLVDGSNAIQFSSPFYFSQNAPVMNDTFIINGDTLLIRITATASFETNKKPNIRLEVRKTSPLRLVLEAVSSNTELHIWNNVRLQRRFTNWGIALVSSYPGSKAGDTDFGLGEPGGVGKEVITVASHFAERLLPNNSMGFGYLSGFTSRGPTVDGRRKPDISGPGHNVTSSVNSFDPNPGAIVQTANFDNKDYPFATYSGTSMSGPAVAGVIALMLEMNPTLSQKEIKEILINSARQDAWTGEIGDTGHLGWGHGKVNALAALNLASTYPVIPSLSGGGKVIIYPNPSRNLVTINTEDYDECFLADMSGKIIATFVLDKNAIDNQIDISKLQSGVYMFVFGNKNQKTNIKFVKY
jgi:minor extracellular serine protease Vpr